MAKQLFSSVIPQLQKRLLLFPAATFSSSSSSPFTVDFLVRECRIPLGSALSTSRKFQLHEKKPQKLRSVLQFLKSHNFTDSQIGSLIIKYPRILHSDVKKTLQPKFDYLVKIGFKGELLPQFIVSNPFPLLRSLDSKIKPFIEFLRPLLDSDKKIVVAVMRSQRMFTSNLKSKLQPNVDLLIKEGVSSYGLGIFILKSRGIFGKHESLIHAVNTVKNLGFEPTALPFIRALAAVMSMSHSTWRNKIEFMKSLGCSEEQIFSAFKQRPCCLCLSVKKVKHSMDFYLNTVKMKPETVIGTPLLLNYSIDKRIRPRYNVLKVLKSKKLIKELKRLSPFLISEKDFQKKFVDRYMDEVPGLMEVYLGTKGSKNTGS